MTVNSSEIPSNLIGLQQWLQSVVTTPWQAYGPGPDDVVRAGNGTLKPAERVGIYTRAYQGRLIECMESEFPALRFALGRDLFVRFASEYLVARPSETYTLTALGKGFPEYLRETRPHDEEELWPEFIIELATLERFFSEVYHGEGTEESDGAVAVETEAILNVFIHHPHFLQAEDAGGEDAAASAEMALKNCPLNSSTRRW
ncbi:MAG: DNA-binding domain-containing protein, partial [Verrucomicrobiota bacterium]